MSFSEGMHPLETTVFSSFIAVDTVAERALEYASAVASKREHHRLPYVVVLDAVEKLSQAYDCFEAGRTVEGSLLLRDSLQRSHDFWNVLPERYQHPSVLADSTHPANFVNLLDALETVDTVALDSSILKGRVTAARYRTFENDFFMQHSNRSAYERLLAKPSEPDGPRAMIH